MPNNNGISIGTLFVQTADVTVGNTGSELTLIGAGVGSMTLPANFFRVGKSVRIRLRGYISDTGSPTLRMRIYFGSTVVLDTTAKTITGTISNNEWFAEGLITCRTTGVSGTVMGQGSYQEEPDNRLGMVNTSTVTINTTTSQLVDVTLQWGTSSPSNTATCTNVILEALN